MSRIIECHVNDEYILGSGVPIGAAGSHDDVALRLIFNEMWDGLNIVATFKDALAESETVIQLMPSMLEEGDSRTYLIWIPGGAKTYAGRVKLTLSGYSVYAVEENGTRIYKKDSLTNTATAFFRVLESDAAIVKDDEDSETTYREIVQAELNEMGKDMEAWERRVLEVEAAEETRDTAEAQRQINEFGNVGYRWNDERTAVVDENGNIIEDNSLTGRVGAELERKAAENKRKSNENKRIEAEGEFIKRSGRVYAEFIRQQKEIERDENEVARLKAEGSADENSEYYGGRALAEAERQGKEEERKKFYETAFVGKKNIYPCAGVFNAEWDTATNYNLANARAATTFGFDNRIVNNEDDLKATYVYQKVFPNDFIPLPSYDDYGESTWGRHSFLAGGKNVLTAYSGVGLGENNVICGHQAAAIGYALRAYSAMQCVVGKCNIPDIPNGNNSGNRGKYAFIVGNGTTSEPSNAFAVRWTGEAELSDGKTIEEHINEAIEKLINGAPGTMDTFAEIAALIGSEGKEATILGDIANNASNIANNATRISTAEALIEEHTKEIENLQAKLDNLVSAEGVSF